MISEEIFLLASTRFSRGKDLERVRLIPRDDVGL
jgi:hypothetical protein